MSSSLFAFSVEMQVPPTHRPVDYELEPRPRRERRGLRTLLRLVRLAPAPAPAAAAR
jgi:hypothetical protein